MACSISMLDFRHEKEQTLMVATSHHQSSFSYHEVLSKFPVFAEAPLSRAAC